MSADKLPKFVFAYREQESVNPDSGAKETVAYPFLPCTFEWGGKRTPQTDGLLDSGSDCVVLPLEFAMFLNLALKDEKDPMRVPGGEIPWYSATANLTIGRAGRLFTFPRVRVAIPKTGDAPVLIGRDPVFKVYRVTFDDPRSRFTLEPSS